jgi:hypothetical protein
VRRDVLYVFDDADYGQFFGLLISLDQASFEKREYSGKLRNIPSLKAIQKVVG